MRLKLKASNKILFWFIVCLVIFGDTVFIVHRDNPIVKIDVSSESKEFLQGQELAVAKEMIRAGIESVSGSVSDFDEFFDSQKERLSKKPVILH